MELWKDTGRMKFHLKNSHKKLGTFKLAQGYMLFTYTLTVNTVFIYKKNSVIVKHCRFNNYLSFRLFHCLSGKYIWLFLSIYSFVHCFAPLERLCLFLLQLTLAPGAVWSPKFGAGVSSRMLSMSSSRLAYKNQCSNIRKHSYI